MAMTGEQFIGRIYKQLHMSEDVSKVSLLSDRQDIKIKKYFETLEQKYNKETVEIWRREIHDRYIVGMDVLEFYQNRENIIETQIKSLDKWINYLTGPGSIYPTWAKYWAFIGMIKIGTYDEKTESYGKRSSKTIAAFIDLDPESLAHSIELVIKYINGEQITDEFERKLAEQGNFAKIYTYYLKEKKEKIAHTSKEGIWIKYSHESVKEAEEKQRNGKTPEYVKLYNSLQGHNTGWCTAGSLGIARDQICGGQDLFAGSVGYEGGDFYVYYTEDEKGVYCIPRIAIRMDGQTKIGEIRGIGESQNLEDGLEEIVERKIKSIEGITEKDINKYLKAILDIKRLTYISKKISKDIPLTIEEQRFLFEIEGKIEGFGWQQDGKINELRSKVIVTDLKTAIALLYDREYPLEYKINISEEIQNNPEYIKEKNEADESRKIVVFDDDWTWDDEEDTTLKR